MSNLHKLLRLAREEGKLFVIDETGEPLAVITSIEQYQKQNSVQISAELADRLQQLTQQTEQLNRQINAAQLEGLDETQEQLDVENPPKPDLTDSAPELYIEPIEQ